MPAKVITFHSYKGGTGKSFLSLNTAAYLSKIDKKNVIVLDFDFRAPTLVHKFIAASQSKIHYLNEFLEGKYLLNEVIYSQTSFLFTDSELDDKIKFDIAYASPKSRDMQEMQMKTRQWQQKALTILMGGLLEIKDKYDVIIIDSSPGITYDSLNAMSSSDAVILIATPDMVDVQGTVDMSSEIYPSLIKFGAQPALVLNKIPWEKDRVLYQTDKIVQKLKTEADLPVITQCPCYCDSTLLHNTILVKENQNHNLIKNVKEIVDHFNSIKPRE
jgi:septum site-determining protein MinD